MPDDQINKASTIDDLVKELSKNNSSNQPPPNLPGVKVEIKPTITAPQPTPIQSEPSKPVQPTPSRPQPVIPSIAPKPPISMPPKPTPPTMPPRPSEPIGMAKPSPIQEYRSSIRTMGEDITSIKSGQKPSGVDVPRRVAPEAPKAPLPGAPAAPAPTGPMSSVGLGKTERTGPLAGLPKPPTIPNRLGPTIGLGQTGKTGPLPPLAGGPPAPEKPSGPFKEPKVQPSIAVPGEKKGLSTTFYLLIAGLLVVGGFLYWFMVLRVAEPEVVVSPTPIPTVTPTPVIRNLSDIFFAKGGPASGGTPINFEIVLSDNISSDFKTFVNTLTVASGDFLKINLVKDAGGTLVPLNWLDMFDMDLAIYPFDLKDSIANSATLVYGQTEMFSKEGVISFDAQDLKKTVFVARVMDMAAVKLMMKDWELTIVEDLADYLLIADTSKEASVNFLDNAYRGASIRYKNFPFPDVAVDYAVVEAAGQSYLVIVGSREAMYATIDVLLGQ